MLNDNRDIKPSENFRTRWSLPAGCKQMIIFPPVKEEMCTALCYLDKYSLNFRQIQFAIQTKTYWDRLHCVTCVTLCYNLLHFDTLHWSDPWPLHEAWVLFWAAQLFPSDTPQTVEHPTTRKFLT